MNVNTNTNNNNFVVLDYEGNIMSDAPATPQTRRYNLRSRNRNTIIETPKTPEKSTNTRRIKRVPLPHPLIFREPETATVEAVAVENIFDGATVYEAEDGSFVIDGFTRGIDYFLERGAIEDPDYTTDDESEDETDDESDDESYDSVSEILDGWKKQINDLGFEAIDDLIDDYRRLVNQAENTESEDEETTEDEEVRCDDLVGFEYEEYGRGYLLYAPEGHPAIGQKYFFDAWWMPKHNAWFFKSWFLRDFKVLGATEIGADNIDEEVSMDDDEEDEEVEYDEHDDLTDFEYEEYGRGYLLYAPEGHPAIGQKYFFDAWWMPKYNGWFFKSQFLENFQGLGATEIGADNHDEEIIENEDEEHYDLDGFEYEEYGRGYLLYAPEGHPAIGQKYFFDAWWMPKHNAWFFKSQFLEDFQGLGANEV